MRDLTDPKWMYVKAALLLFGGLLASAILWLERPTLRTALLLVVAIWSFARAYYFMFYVIERYVDPSYRFAGLLDFVRYQLRRKRS
jgi:hypothetical protein